MEQRFPLMTPVVRGALFVLLIGGAVLLRDFGVSPWIAFPVAAVLLAAANVVVPDRLGLPDPFDRPAPSDRGAD
jgi:hypothetical protein